MQQALKPEMSLEDNPVLIRKDEAIDARLSHSRLVGPLELRLRTMIPWPAIAPSALGGPSLLNQGPAGQSAYREKHTAHESPNLYPC